MVEVDVVAFFISSLQAVTSIMKSLFLGMRREITGLLWSIGGHCWLKIDYFSSGVNRDHSNIKLVSGSLYLVRVAADALQIL